MSSPLRHQLHKANRFRSLNVIVRQPRSCIIEGIPLFGHCL